MDLKNMKLVERLLMILGCLSIACFVAGYYINMIFFYCFLVCAAALFAVWTGFWKCPHCGKHLWYNFDAPCKGCHRNIFEEPEKKLKNTKEKSGFFGL